MQPAAIALNCSIENIRNDLHQIMIIIIIEKFQFDSLVWGSLTLTPITGSIVCCESTDQLPACVSRPSHHPVFDCLLYAKTIANLLPRSFSTVQFLITIVNCTVERPELYSMKALNEVNIMYTVLQPLPGFLLGGALGFGLPPLDMLRILFYGKLCLCKNSPRFHQIVSNKRSKINISPPPPPSSWPKS